MKVAIVTGSGKKRVGAAVAVALAQKGYAIAVHYRNSQAEANETVKELQAFNVIAKPYPADLRNETEVKSFVAKVLVDFGRVDVLVNTAAIWNSKKLEDTTAADVSAHFETNALGTFLMCQHVGLAMTKQAAGGVIINIGDWATVRPYLHYAAYFPSKGAVEVLTRTMAVELAYRNPRVRVNCILPGPVMLPPDLPENEKNEAIQGTLLKKEGSPAHIAHAVLALVENDFITGVCLPVDGGRTLNP